MGQENSHTPHHPLRLALGPERIKESKIPSSELVEVQYNHGVWGPIWIRHLKAHLEVFPQLKKGLLVKTFNEDTPWGPVASHPFFLPPSSTPPPLPGQEQGPRFFLIQNARRLGPFTKEQIQEKLQDGQIMASDLISLDGGQSWSKISKIQGLAHKASQENIHRAYGQIQDDTLSGLQALEGLTTAQETPYDEKEEGPPVRYWTVGLILAISAALAAMGLWNDSSYHGPQAQRSVASVRPSPRPPAKNKESSQQRPSKELPQRP